MHRALILFSGVGLFILALVGCVSLRQGGGDHLARPAASAGAAASDPAVLSRLDAKAAVTRRLIDGELTLMDAAAWFRYLDMQDRLAGKFNPWTDSTGSEEERCCREVISWAHALTASSGSPEQADALVRRLEAELAAHLKDAVQ